MKLNIMPATRLKLTLYVQPSNSRQALASLYQALEYHSYTDYELELIDVTQEPTKALEGSITKTPTLVLKKNGDIMIQTNDLSNISKVRAQFGFKSDNQ